MPERQTKIIMFEGPQGSGKTTAATFLGQCGYRVLRGIPTGEELIKNSEVQNWQKSLMILSQNALNNHDRYSMDRSFWSLVAYNMRKKPQHAELIYRQGKSLFERKMNGIPYCLVLIDSDPQECLEREDKNSVVAIEDITEAANEVVAYKRLADCLERDGFSIIRINNNGVSREQFLAQVEHLFQV